MSKKWYNYFVETPPTETPPAQPPGESPAPPPRAADLVKDAGADAELSGPVTTPVSFDDVYGAAQIQAPAHGYSVLKVAEMLQSEHLQALPVDVKKKSIMVALDAAGVKVADIVEDAVRRDRALDTYERVLQKNLEQLRGEKERENKQLEEHDRAQPRRRIDRRAEANSNRRLVWRARKQQEENRIAEAVGYFVSANPITTPAVQNRQRRRRCSTRLRPSVPGVDGILHLDGRGSRSDAAGRHRRDADHDAEAQLGAGGDARDRDPPRGRARQPEAAGQEPDVLDSGGAAGRLAAKRAASPKRTRSSCSRSASTSRARRSS